LEDENTKGNSPNYRTDSSFVEANCSEDTKADDAMKGKNNVSKPKLRGATPTTEK
jgi:hypothetical protein